MKKSLFLALALSVSAMATDCASNVTITDAGVRIVRLATPAPVAAPAPAETPAPAPVASPAPEAAPAEVSASVNAPAQTSSFALEIGGVYNHMTNRMNAYYDGIDMYGVDMTAIYNVNKNWSVNVRVGYSYGSETYTFYEAEYNEGYSDKVELSAISLMPGIRYTAPLCEKASWYIGANAGYAWYEGELKEVGSDFCMKGDESGFAYSAELGLRYNLSESLYVFGAAQVNGCLVKEPYEPTAEEVFNVGVRAGVGCQF